MEEVMRKPQAGSLADEREQMWLSDMDEFGMMIIVVLVIPKSDGDEKMTRWPKLWHTGLC